MKRDMDLIRDLLLEIENNPQYNGSNWVPLSSPSDLGISDRSEEEVTYHLNMLIEAGFVRGQPSAGGMPVINSLTWPGHEFLDNIRDPGVWGKIKERLKGLPSAGITIIAEIAKREIMKHVGLS